MILGRAYFHYLCKTDAGIHIYDTVELGVEYWSLSGSPKFYTSRGKFDEAFFETKYEYRTVDNFPVLGSFLNIRNRLFQVFDNDTERVLGEKSHYYYGGKRVMNTWQPFSGGKRFSCLSNSDLPNNLTVARYPEDYSKFTSHIFLNKQ